MKQCSVADTKTVWSLEFQVVLFLSLIFCKQEYKLLFFGSVSGCTYLILFNTLKTSFYELFLILRELISKYKHQRQNILIGAKIADRLTFFHLFYIMSMITDYSIYYNLLNILLYLLTYDLKIGAKRPIYRGETTRDLQAQ